MKKHLQIYDQKLISKIEKLKEFYDIEKDIRLVELIINKEYSRVFLEKEETKVEPVLVTPSFDLPIIKKPERELTQDEIFL